MRLGFRVYCEIGVSGLGFTVRLAGLGFTVRSGLGFTVRLGFRV